MNVNAQIDSSFDDEIVWDSEVEVIPNITITNEMEKRISKLVVQKLKELNHIDKNINWNDGIYKSCVFAANYQMDNNVVTHDLTNSKFPTLDNRFYNFTNNLECTTGEVCSGGGLIIDNLEDFNNLENILVNKIIENYKESKGHWSIITHNSYTNIAFAVKLKIEKDSDYSKVISFTTTGEFGVKKSLL